MSDFKNSFYTIATEIAKKNPLAAPGQLTLIDNFTAESPILKGLPFEQASHDCHHVHGRLLDATSMQVIDFDGVLPSMQTDSQLESVHLTPFGGKFEFGEDRMRLTHKTPESFLAAQIPPVLRKTGMALEHSIYLNNFLPTTIKKRNGMVCQHGSGGGEIVRLDGRHYVGAGSNDRIALSVALWQGRPLWEIV